MSSREIDQVLKAAVDSGGVPCVVAMAADDKGVVYEGAAGTRTPASGDAVTPDTMLRIASMTKMVATVAALQQVERGNLDLDAPVEEYRPEFADVPVLDGFDGDTPRLRPPATRATVHQLVTHTTGLGYWFINADIARWEQLMGNPNVMSGSNEIFNAPMVADPGTKFEYGINFDWLGKVVEAAAGQGPRQVRRREPHRPARHGQHDLDHEPRPAGQLHPGPCAGRGRRLGGHRR